MTATSQDSCLSIEDFHGSGWRDALSAEWDGYDEMQRAFISSTEAKRQEGDAKASRIHGLLAAVCSLTLVPEDMINPFQLPYLNQAASSISEMFSENDLSFFLKIVHEVDHPWLQARLADILWVAQRQKELQLALLAIDAYRKIPVDPETWVRDGCECWSRALLLARKLDPATTVQLLEMETHLLSRLETSTIQDNYLPLWIAHFLEQSKLNTEKTTNIAEKLETLADDLQADAIYLQAGSFFEQAKKWYEKASNPEKSWLMVVNRAETFAMEADRKSNAPKPSFLAASHFFERAIQTYRSIPRSERGAFSVDSRLDELRKQMESAQKKSIEEMIEVESPLIDVTGIAEKAKSLISGKTFPEALFAFINLSCSMDVEKLKNSARKHLSSSLYTLFPANYITSDGRISARYQGRILDSSASDQEGDSLLQAQMINQYLLHVGVCVCGVLSPALSVMQIEHPVREAEFAELCAFSGRIPLDRVSLIAKGLYAGYNNDFVVALHILIPQLENIVRELLKAQGAQTSTLDSLGIETVNGLSTLLKSPAITGLLGTQEVFELKALFCEPFGPNLRNELAHGLMDETRFQSCEALYAWWWILRFVLKQ